MARLHKDRGTLLINWWSTRPEVHAQNLISVIHFTTRKKDLAVFCHIEMTVSCVETVYNMLEVISLTMEAAGTSKMLENVYQKTAIFILTAVRTSNPTLHLFLMAWRNKRWKRNFSTLFLEVTLRTPDDLKTGVCHKLIHMSRSTNLNCVCYKDFSCNKTNLCWWRQGQSLKRGANFIPTSPFASGDFIVFSRRGNLASDLT